MGILGVVFFFCFFGVVGLKMKGFLLDMIIYVYNGRKRKIVDVFLFECCLLMVSGFCVELIEVVKCLLYNDLVGLFKVIGKM